MIEEARKIALAALEGETRYDGSPFISHADGVADIVTREIGLPETCAAAVYLHEATRTHSADDGRRAQQDFHHQAQGYEP